ncbi:sensor domain-containing diguanylate cyclase [Chitiniphilus eburneus]|uniref:diguanylate cyclase n=1 Tax=Chitiniphilus eburneus TaxID=2571148 RepID=A0A4V5MQA2_9NEIS|nr:diguanylate cyclase [Chitiniphilus eburneus]TJZ71678.1 sensor domain-containing diguanylate cyclase [Chitiniphilus eburneus]
MTTAVAHPSPARLTVALLLAFALTAALSAWPGRLAPGMPPVFWLPAGIGLATLLLMGRLGVLLCFIGNLLVGWAHYRIAPDGNQAWLLPMLAILDTGQAWLAASQWRQRELQGHRPLLQRPRELIFFWGRVCALPALMGILPALLTLTTSGIPLPAMDETALTTLEYVTGNILGMLLIAPCLVIWRDRRRWSIRRRVEHWWWPPQLALVVVIVLLVMNGSALVLLLPVLLGTTIYYRLPGVTLSLLLISVSLTVVTASGGGPYDHATQHANFLDLHLFLFSVTLTLQYMAFGQEQLLEYQRELKHDVALRTRELRKANARLAEMATTDELTGVANRREWQRHSAEAMMLSRRTDEPLSVLMLDLDHFKSVNDTYGHLIGDLVLRAVCRACEGALRATDHFGRWGGEEFVVLLPNTGDIEAAQVAEKLRYAAAATWVDHNERRVQVTISVGVTTLRPNDATLDDLIKRADDALYSAKRAGRNRVMVAPSVMPGGDS